MIARLRKNLRSALPFAFLIAGTAGYPAAAVAAGPPPPQNQAVDHRWGHGATLAAIGGVGTASDDTGALLGGTIGWEITPRFSVEGTGLWLDRQTGASAFAAGLNLHAVLTKTHPAAPFVEGGFGMYLASFDPDRAVAIPPFYADRMSSTATNWFTDPAFFGGAGVNVFKSAHLAIRPTAGALVAVHDGRSYSVGLFSVRVEYHFENHPVRP